MVSPFTIQSNHFDHRTAGFSSSHSYPMNSCWILVPTHTDVRFLSCNWSFLNSGRHYVACRLLNLKHNFPSKHSSAGYALCVTWVCVGLVKLGDFVKWKKWMNTKWMNTKWSLSYKIFLDGLTLMISTYSACFRTVNLHVSVELTLRSTVGWPVGLTGSIVLTNCKKGCQALNTYWLYM